MQQNAGSRGGGDDGGESVLPVWERFLTQWFLYAKIHQQKQMNIEEAADALFECALALNYAFDHHWMLPIVKWLYQQLVRLSMQADDQLLRGQHKATKVKQACVALDALRNKMQDRYPFPATRKAGIVFVMNMTFRCYFRVSL